MKWLRYIIKVEAEVPADDPEVISDLLGQIFKHANYTIDDVQVFDKEE